MRLGFVSRLVLSVFVFSLFVFFFAVWMDRPSGEAVQLSFASAPSSDQVATELVHQGVIRSAFGYQLFAWLDGAAGRAKAGTYKIQPGVSYHTIARMLALGPARREAQILIIEGRTLDEIGDELKQTENISADHWTELVGRSADRARFASDLRMDYPFLQNLPPTRSLEGYLFPDTYRVWADQLPEGLVRKQLDEFQTRFSMRAPEDRLAPLKTLDDVVILASLVEKEVRDPYDRRIVAGIFLNRLRDGMPLQSDATLNYLLDSNRSRANAQDLAVDSPFNSYKKYGLPPSPICNPGASAIEAVFNPVSTPYRFFLTDRAGKVYYAKTYEEHLQNKKKAGY